LIYGKDELNLEDLERIKELKNLELYFCENLHAKCYFNENLMVISSMNLHEFSQTNNREMGVQIKIEEDPELFNDAKNEGTYIIKASIKEISETKISDLEEYKEKYQGKGYCMRCKTEIEFNPQSGKKVKIHNITNFSGEKLEFCFFKDSSLGFTSAFFFAIF